MKGFFISDSQSNEHHSLLEEPGNPSGGMGGGDSPMEQDIPVGDDNTGTMPDPDETSNIETNINMDIEDDNDELGDPNFSNIGGQTGIGMGTEQPNEDYDKSDNSKKRKLFDEYGELIDTIDDLLEISNIILTTPLSNREIELFNEINLILEDNKEKLINITSKRFLDTSYKKLLTVYLYTKMVVKSYSRILNIFSDTREE